MANRNHALDDRIIEAARTEFLKYGYQKASLHKIAENAGITTGALYTRYQNKNDLFSSLVETAIMEISSYFHPLKALYAAAREAKDAEKLLDAIKQEEKMYLDVLFNYYEECLLFFCCSEGSTVSTMLQEMQDKKAKKTVQFLKEMTGKDVNFEGVELIIHEQFHHYREILKNKYSREDAIACMQTVQVFLEAGWRALFEYLLQ